MPNLLEINTIRREFNTTPMQVDQLPEKPHSLFEIWFAQTLDAPLDDPTACILATVDAQGNPDTRVVLLKNFSEGAFIFYTNYCSKKAQQITHNPNVALNFYWPSLCRQVRIKGLAAKMDAAISENYFHSRPRESQIAAYASQQSTVITRAALKEAFEKYEKKFANDPIIPYPKFWGGYCVTPCEFEFWQGRPHRLHDRVQYLQQDGQWIKQVLAP